MKTRSFLVVYCRRTGMSPAAFAGELLARTLYPWAARFRWWIDVIDPDCFAEDYAFIERISHMRQRSDFAIAVEEFLERPANRSFLRSRLRLRISVRRMLEEVNAIFPPNLPPELNALMQPEGTHHPFWRPESRPPVPLPREALPFN